MLKFIKQKLTFYYKSIKQIERKSVRIAVYIFALMVTLLSVVILLMLLSIILLLVYYSINKSLNNNVILLNLTLEKIVNITIIGAFLISLITVVTVVFDYANKKNKAYNTLSLFLECKNEYVFAPQGHISSNNVDKLQKKIFRVINYKSNDLDLEIHKKNRDKLSKLLIRGSEENAGKTYTQAEALVKQISFITHGHKELIYSINDENQVIFNTNIMFAYSVGDIYYYYLKIDNNNNFRILVLSISDRGVKIYLKKFTYLTLSNKSGSTNIKGLNIKLLISFYNKNKVIGSVYDFLNINQIEHYNYEFKILNMSKNIFQVPIFMSNYEIYTILENISARFITDKADQAILKVSEVNYISSTKVEYVLEHKYGKSKTKRI